MLDMVFLGSKPYKMTRKDSKLTDSDLGEELFLYALENTVDWWSVKNEYLLGGTNTRHVSHQYIRS